MEKSRMSFANRSIALLVALLMMVSVLAGMSTNMYAAEPNEGVATVDTTDECEGGVALFSAEGEKVSGTISASKGTVGLVAPVAVEGDLITLTPPSDATIQYATSTDVPATDDGWTTGNQVIVKPATNLWVRATAAGKEPSDAVLFRYGAEGDVIDIFSFNDFHGAVDKSTSVNNPGADRFVAIVKELQKENDNNLIYAAGDSYLGTAISVLFQGKPVSDMFKQLGVKYSAIGHHDFDWGPSQLVDYFIPDGEIEFLAANMFNRGETTRPDYVKPYTIEEIAGKKIGVIGLSTSEINTIVGAKHVKDIYVVDSFSDEASAWLSEMISKLKTEENCDAVIALTQLSSYQAPGGAITGMAADLANSAAGSQFDAIISGRSHQVVAGAVNGIPIVQGYSSGRGLGRLNLYFSDDGLEIIPKAYNQTDMNSSNILPAPPLPYNSETDWDLLEVDETMKGIIANYNAQIATLLDRAVGTYGVDINSKYEQAVWANQLLYDFIVREANQDYILVQNAGGWRDTVTYGIKAADPVTVRYLYNLMQFDNEIILMDLPGDKLLDILNDHTQFATEPMVNGVERVGSNWVTVNGTVVEPTGTYKVATNDFMQTGGDNYVQFASGTNVTHMGVLVRDALIEQLEYRANSVLEPADLSISVTPNYAVVATTSDIVELRAQFNGEISSYSNVTWSVSPDNIVKFVDDVAKGESVKIQLLNNPVATTVTVTAKYKSYSASAVIEVLDAPVGEDGTVVSILKSKITVNTAKEVGALVPLLISSRDDIVSAASVSATADLGSNIISAVRLEAKASKNADWTIVPNITASMHDAGNIRIDAESGAKTTKNVRVSVLPAGKADAAANWVEAGIISTLTITTKYPSIKLSASTLNRALPGNKAMITATSADGVCEILGVTGAGLKHEGAGVMSLDGATKSVKADVDVKVAGYKASPYKKTPTVTIKVVNTKPALKLSASSVTIVDNKVPFTVNLLSSKKNVPFEVDYQVSGVKLDASNAKNLGANDLSIAYANGIITVTSKEGIQKGTAVLAVSFANTDATMTVPLKLKINVKTSDKVAPSIKTNKVTVNKEAGKLPATGSTIINIPVSLGVANVFASDWKIYKLGKNDTTELTDTHTLAGAIEIVPGANMITLKVKNSAKIADLGSKHELYIGSPGVNGDGDKGKLFKMTLTMSAKPAKISSIGLKGGIDILNPDSVANATVKLAETTSAIQSVELINGNGAISADFAAQDVVGNTFQVKVLHNEVVPAKQTLTARVKLENGQTLEKNISITPKMGKLKSAQSVKEITLYKAIPKSGQPVSLDLTAPAGVKLGRVAINEASLKTMGFANGGFELVQSGGKEWVIRFMDGKVPTVPANKKMKASYTLKLDLWAEGTYVVDMNGVVKPLMSGDKAKTKPLTVSIKVNMA